MHAGMFTYAWDLEAEGYDRAIGEMAGNGITHIDLATAYHTGKFLLPRNPRHRTYFPEDGATYFRPDPSRYGRIQPRVSSLVTASGDPVSRLIEAAGRHGVRYAAWVVLMHNTWLGTQFPDATVHTPFGDPLIHSLNPAHPDVREYVLALIGDLVSRHEVDALILEAPGYLAYTHGWHHEFQVIELDPVQERLMGMSFSPVDIEAAATVGIDAARLRERIATLLDRAWNEGYSLLVDGETHPDADALLGDPEFLAYRDWQEQQVLSLSREIRAVVQAASPGTEIRHFAMLDGGAAPEALLRTGDAVLTGYAASDADAAARAEALRPLGMPVIGMVRALPPDTTAPGQLARRVEAWRSAGVDGIDTYNYGFMPRHRLRELYAALR